MASDLTFEWDPAKNALNLRRHKVSFEDASTVFLDENALLIADPDHSEEDDRFVLLGLSASLQILLVCHCCKPRMGTIRLISARKADRQERQDYIRRFKP
jgi:uncharacterized DUF497 family protein